MPGYHAGRPPRNKGIRYPADPPTVEEIVAVMRHAADDRHGWRVRAMVVVLWRAGLRVQEALALAEHDLDHRRGSLLVRNGKGGRRREVGMDEWGWAQLRPWLGARAGLPVGPLFCVIDGPTRVRPWSGAAVRSEFRRLAARAGVRRRFAPHQLRHAHALELAREGVALNIMRQLGHANLGTTSIYLQGIDPEEIIATVRTRRGPMMSASAGLRLLIKPGHCEWKRHARSRSAPAKASAWAAQLTRSSLVLSEHVLSPGRDDRFPRRCDSEPGGDGVSATTRQATPAALPISRGEKPRARPRTVYEVACGRRRVALADARAR
jgi:hypothetical protein